jgi:SPX domain protein involved in polyphosphate accumulation
MTTFNRTGSVSLMKLRQEKQVYGGMILFTANDELLYREIAMALERTRNGHAIDLAEATSATPSSLQPSKGFLDLFESELLRVSDYIDAQQKGLEFSAKTLLTSAEVALELGCFGTEEETIHCLRFRAEHLADHCVKLQQFVTENKSKLLNVAREADSKLRTACMGLLDRQFANTGNNSSLVCVMSDVYDTIRAIEEKQRNSGSGRGEPSSVWKAPSSFERSTTKYWVEDRHLTQLLLACAAEAPLLVYGRKGKLTSKKDRLARKQSDGGKLWDELATSITSVYFDSNEMSLYNDRLVRVEGAQLLRARYIFLDGSFILYCILGTAPNKNISFVLSIFSTRWYGSKPSGDEIIYLELKTHHEKWINTKSVKERAEIQEQDMVTFLQKVPWSVADAEAMVLRAKPSMKGEELSKATDRLLRMHQLVVRHNLAPCVRSVYKRAAFQSPKSNGMYLCPEKCLSLLGLTCRVLTQNSSSCLSSFDLRFAFNGW